MIREKGLRYGESVEPGFAQACCGSDRGGAFDAGHLREIVDDNGNSLLGTLALERLSERMGWSDFG